MSFKVGDTVECLDSVVGYLQKGKEYIICFKDIKNKLCLEGVPGSWHPRRFKLSKKSFINRMLKEI